MDLGLNALSMVGVCHSGAYLWEAAEYKMQSDSVQFSTSGPKNQAVPEECSAKSFHCTKCTLIFKSKVYLFEHLNKVHCLDVDASLRGAGLKYAERKKANSENSRPSGQRFVCRSCDFKTCSQDALTKHEAQCERTESSDLTETVVSGSTERETAVTLANQASEEEEAPSLKDLKTYKRPSQTIGSYFTESSGSNEKLKLVSDTKETLILVDNPPEPNLHWTAVSKVSTKPWIDVYHRSDKFLQRDHLYHAMLGASDPAEEQTKMAVNEIGRRTDNESSKGPKTKKAKLESENTREETEDRNRKHSGSTEFAFEVSEDEEEKKVRAVDRDPAPPNVYFCKHCDYSDMSVRLVSAHYHSNHPYVRCNDGYIQQSADQSATFRCLECPVEFLSTGDLKWHYTEKHPEVPDVFKMKSNELRLLFRCFTCTFTCHEVKALKHHYKERHPTCEVDNSLLFCKYFASKCPMEPCEKTSSPERSADLSPKRPSASSKDVEITHSLQPPTPTRPDVSPYKCSRCDFEHKSAVVMHVHYQKKHPERAVTIDEIKRLAHSKSQLMPEKETSQGERADVHVKEEPAASTVRVVPEVSKSPSDLLRIEDIRSLVDGVTKGKPASKPVRKTTSRLEDLEMDEKVPSQKAKRKPELTVQDATLSPPEHTSEAGKKTSELSAPKHVKSAKNKSSAKMSASKPNTQTTGSKSEKLLCSSPLEMHYCQFCDYASPQIRSVIGHHNAKHSGQILLSKEDIIQYSAEVMENKAKTQMISETSNHIEKSSKIEAQLKRSGSKKNQPYVLADKLFYCHLCNFGNPSTQGVIAHQNRVHKYRWSNRESIIKYSSSIHKKIKESKLQGKTTTPTQHLPLPIVRESDKDMFFCRFCNYKNRVVSAVLHHCSRVHHVSNETANIHTYTAMVLKQLQKSPLQSAVNPEPQEEATGKEETANSSSETISGSASLSAGSGDTRRKLPCKYCPFTTQYVFLLMSHMRKTHCSKFSVTRTLRLCYRKGVLEPGYHCEWCAFSHKKAEAVHKHYQEWHPGCKHASLATIKTRLYVGPNFLFSKDKKTELKPGHQGLRSQSSEKNDKPYQCTACSFKSYSKFALERHSNQFHPSPAKGDVSDLQSDKGTRGKSQLEELNEMPGLFESFQVPFDVADQEDSSSTVFKCSLCPATFNRKHGLSVHCGIKHLEDKNAKEPKKHAEKTERRVHVFKCPYCNYINTSHQGVLTHCYMKHPASPSSADSLHLDPARLQDWDEKRNASDETLKFSGYTCKACPRICATLKKLMRHREQEHNETAPGGPKPSDKPSLVLKIKLAQPHKTHKSVSKASLLTKNVYGRLKCQQCPYVASTNVGLSKHVLKQHKKAAPKDCVYKCVLCPQTYSFKRRLSKHYARTHGRGAYLKYYVPVYKPGRKKQEPSSQPQQHNSKDKRFIYRCPSCPYVNTTYHGTLTHSQMKHPSVVVRADELETGEISVSSIIRCSKGKGSYERGYLCKRCPQVHPSIKKLKAHCQKEHGGAAVSELFSEYEADKRDGDGSLAADEVAAPLKTTSQDPPHPQGEPGEEAASGDGGSRADASEAAPSRKALLKKDLSYKCQLCVYSTFSRKNLQAHYKGGHKLDALNTYKMLERYNKRKNNFLLKYFRLKKPPTIKCKKCPDSTFDSSQLLIDHYNTFHKLGSKSDFIVLSFGVRKESTGLFKCKFCRVNLYGTRKLWRHLDRHRDQAKPEAAKKTVSLVRATPGPPSPEVSQQDKLIKSESAEELSQRTDTPAVARSLSISPQTSPSKLSDVGPEAEGQEGGHRCKRCQRAFMSYKGLRLHERSHAAMGAIKKLDNLVNTEFKHSIKKYLFHKPETVKPYLCGCCSYRTNFMALWQSHFLKNHQDIIENDLKISNKDEEISQSSDKEFPDSSEKMNNFPELNEEPEDVEESTESYSEPPDVQRQLTHYSLMAQNVDKTNVNLHQINLYDSFLQCEMCNFNTEHLSSIRRHYANRHGKKVLRCKDCDFFTGVRKNMEMHIETGHSTCQSKPTHLKDLRCPFCLYQTKNKNNMIDHIVLHREERVVPIEVRRPKLSRYLQGIVFRCHKCTFTSGRAENLRLHMMRHDDVKPYKCRLCYFDCTRLKDLEAHLSDKHQVLRNHELVGQVSLDKLEARTGTRLEKEDDHKSDSEELEAGELNSDRDADPQTENVLEYHPADTILPIKEVQGSREQKESERTPSNSSVSDITQQNTSAPRRHEQDLQTQEQNVALRHSEKEQHKINTEVVAEELNEAGLKSDGCSFAEEESKIHITLSDGQKENAAERPLTSFKMADVQANRLHLKESHQKPQSIEARVEDDIVRHVLQLDQDGSVHKSHRRPDQERNTKIDQSAEANGVENETSAEPLLIKVCSTSLAQNLKFEVNVIPNLSTAKFNSEQGSESKRREGFRFEPHLLTLSQNFTRPLLGHRERLGRLLANSKQEQKHGPDVVKDESDPSREATGPGERVKEEQPHLERCEETEELKLDREAEINKKDEDECEVQDTPHVRDDALAALDGAAELLCEKSFTCELCGRNLTNSSELNRHVMRHGI
ncbi:uncharacterized protein V3H82_008663 [Fundulus diaphanus]